MIGRRKVLELEQDYRAGYNRRAAARRCEVNYGSTCRYFDQFEKQGLPRKTRPRKPYTPYWRLPIYTGPDWIGKPA